MGSKICPACRQELAGYVESCPFCSWPLPVLVGRMVAGKYLLVEKVGKGGMGNVYRAEHLEFRESRAIKVLSEELAQRKIGLQRFRREVMLTRQASRESEHVVFIYDDFGFEEEVGRYYVMEYLNGLVLSERLRRGGAAPDFSWIIHVGAQICEAMEVAHRQGIVHRDLKPDNIFLVSHRAQPEFVKVVDFGIAKPLQPDSIETRGVLGTPYYMSPEQCRGISLDGRSDIYSLGVLLFQMLTGTFPFPGDNHYQLLLAHVSQEPPRPRQLRPERNIPERLDQVVYRCLAKLPDDRFPNMLECRNALLAALPHQETLEYFAGLSSITEEGTSFSETLESTNTTEEDPSSLLARTVSSSEALAFATTEPSTTQEDLQPPEIGSRSQAYSQASAPNTTQEDLEAPSLPLQGLDFHENQPPPTTWPAQEEETLSTAVQDTIEPTVRMDMSHVAPLHSTPQMSVPPPKNPEAKEQKQNTPTSKHHPRKQVMLVGGLGRYPNEGTQTNVTLTRHFMLWKYELTQIEFKTLMGYNPSKFQHCGNNCPVEQVNWHEAVAFCNALSRQRGLSECFSCTPAPVKGQVYKGTCKIAPTYAGNGGKDYYKCPGYRLPTEAEWEYAARAGTSTAFYNGTITRQSCDPLDPNLNKIGWYCGNSAVQYQGCVNLNSFGGPKCAGTHPVGQKQANAFGLYDTLGSIWEWCWDWGEKKYPGGNVENLVGPASGTKRAHRGASWRNVAGRARVAFRYWSTPDGRSEEIGFRVCRTVP